MDVSVMLTVVLEQITWLATAPSAIEQFLSRKPPCFQGLKDKSVQKEQVRSRSCLQQDSDEVKKVSD